MAIDKVEEEPARVEGQRVDDRFWPCAIFVHDNAITLPSQAQNVGFELKYPHGIPHSVSCR